MHLLLWFPFARTERAWCNDDARREDVVEVARTAGAVAYTVEDSHVDADAARDRLLSGDSPNVPALSGQVGG